MRNACMPLHTYAQICMHYQARQVTPTVRHCIAALSKHCANKALSQILAAYPLICPHMHTAAIS